MSDISTMRHDIPMSLKTEAMSVILFIKMRSVILSATEKVILTLIFLTTKSLTMIQMMCTLSQSM